MSPSRKAQGRYTPARRLLEEALPLARELDNPLVLSQVLGNLGTLTREQGDFPQALALLREGLAFARGLGPNINAGDQLHC